MRSVDKDIPCLVDSGCEITLVLKSVVDKVEGIAVQPSTRQVWAANRTDMVIIGEVVLPFELEGRRVETFALVTADIEEVMLGFDWLKKHQCLWDFRNSRLYVNGHKAVMLSRKRSLVCRRVYVQGNVTLEACEQLSAPARATLLRLFERIMPKQTTAEAVDSIRIESGVYVGRTLLPHDRHRDLYMRVINTTQASRPSPTAHVFVKRILSKCWSLQRR